jgi:hypothetical protein
MTTTPSIAARIHLAIGRNVDRWWDDRITRTQFNRNQDRLWRLAEKSGVNDTVARLIGEKTMASRTGN